MKKIIALLLVCVMAFTLCACHGTVKKSGFTLPDEFDTTRDYTVTFWAKNDTNKTQVEIYKKAIADFEALYPNIHIEIKMHTDYNEIYNNVINNIVTGTTPDVCITYPDHIATYITGDNVVVPLDELFTDEKYGLGGSELAYDGPTRDEMVEKFMDECKIGDSYYAIPFMRSTEACYVNTDYVEKLGFTMPETLTWDFIWEVSEAAMEKDADGNFKVNGQKVMIPCIYKSTDNMMITMLRQLGADYSDASGNIGLFNDTTKGILTEIAKHAKTGAFSTFKISSYPGNFLNAGQCIFAIDSTAGATWMGSDAPLMDIHKNNVVDFNIEVMTVPQYDTENTKMISQGPSICVFNKDDPQQVLASWLFAQYLLTNETQINYAKTEGYVPVTLKAQQSEEYADYLARCGEDNDEHYEVKIKASKLLIDNTENTFTTAVFNGSTALRNAAGQLIESVTKAERRKITVDDAYIEKTFSDTVSLYRLDSITSEKTTDTDTPLPTGAKALICSLLGAWVCIGFYVGFNKIRAKRKNKNKL